MAKKPKCDLCGKKGLRYCSASLENICSRCCGVMRNKIYICSSSCKHNPFGEKSYDLFCQLEKKWTKKAIHLIMLNISKSKYQKAAKKILHENNEAFICVLHHYLLNHHITKKGISLGQQWLDENYPPLNNDEILITKNKLKSYTTIIEIQNIINNYSVECIDIFDTEKKKFIVYDKMNASNSVRFSKMLVLLTHQQFYSRIEGIGILIPENISDDFINYIIKKTFDSYGNANKEHISKYVTENFSNCVGMIHKMLDKQYKKMLKNIDFHQCIAWYKIIGKRDEIIDILNNKPDFEYDNQKLNDGDPIGTEYYTWLRLGESQKIEDNMITPIKYQANDQSEMIGGLGKIVLQPEYFIIEMLSKQKYYFALEMVEKYFGGKLKKEKEIINDLAKQMLNKKLENDENDNNDYGENSLENTASPDTYEVPFEIQKELIQKSHKSHYNNLLDEKIPMIDNMTPREAANIPAMRPKLIELFKLHINGIERDNKDRGFDLNIDWVLKELGLNELII